MTRLLLAILTACVFALAIAPAAPTRAQQAPPSNFVAGIECHGVPPAATFVLPDTAALVARFGDAPVIWVDLTLDERGLDTGYFIGAGPFLPQPGGSLFAWRGLVNDRVHYYRLNALLPYGWREIGRGTFRVPDCNHAVAMHCSSDGTVAVRFQLPPVRSRFGTFPDTFWIDVSLFNNGYVPGTYVSAGPFPASPAPSPGSDTFTWSGLLPGLRHEYRIDALYGAVRLTQAIENFVTTDCRGLPAPRNPL